LRLPYNAFHTIRLYLFLLLRLRPLHVLVVLCWRLPTQHGLFTQARRLRLGAALHALRPFRRDHLDRRHHHHGHGAHRTQPLLLLALRQDGWLHINEEPAFLLVNHTTQVHNNNEQKKTLHMLVDCTYSKRTSAGSGTHCHPSKMPRATSTSTQGNLDDQHPDLRRQLHCGFCICPGVGSSTAFPSGATPTALRASRSQGTYWMKGATSLTDGPNVLFGAVGTRRTHQPEQDNRSFTTFAFFRNRHLTYPAGQSSAQSAGSRLQSRTCLDLFQMYYLRRPCFTLVHGVSSSTPINLFSLLLDQRRGFTPTHQPPRLSCSHAPRAG
jgi:hypothetical protein